MTTTRWRLPDIVVDDDADVVHLSSLFFDDDANFPGTQLVLFFDFQSFIVQTHKLCLFGA